MIPIYAGGFALNHTPNYQDESEIRMDRESGVPAQF